MTKVLLLLLVAVVAWLLLTKTRQPPPAGRKPSTQRQPPQPAQMVACAHCGVHLPQPEALQDGAGRHFCSEAHRVAGPR